MATIYGIGTALCGVSKPNADELRTGTRWFTFVYLPVVPLSRLRFRYNDPITPALTRNRPYTTIAKEPLDIGEILTTYLLSWVIGPLILIVPIVFIFPLLPARGLAGIVLTIAVLAWMIICIAAIIPRLMQRFAPDPPED